MSEPFENISFHPSTERKELVSEVSQLWLETQRVSEAAVDGTLKLVKEHPLETAGAICLVGLLAKNPVLRAEISEVAARTSVKTSVLLDNAVMNCRRKIEIPILMVGRHNPLNCVESAGSNFSKSFIRARQSVACLNTSRVDAEGEAISGHATAFAASKNGRFLTNFHVVKDFDNFTLTDRFGKYHPAKLISTDPLNDLAVLKLENSSSHVLFRPLEFGKSLSPGHDLKSSDDAYCFGHPQTNKLTASLKSNLCISKAEARVATENGYSIIPFRTRAGNSGSPVLNSQGQVIGIIHGARSKGTPEYMARAVVIPSEHAEVLLARPGK